MGPGASHIPQVNISRTITVGDKPGMRELESILQATDKGFPKNPPRGERGISREASSYETPKAQHSPGGDLSSGDCCDLSESDPETDVVLGVTQDRNVRSRCQCSMCPAIHIN